MSTDWAYTLPSHFIKLLDHDFDNVMTFPPTFSTPLEQFTPNTATIDSGQGIWKVNIEWKQQTQSVALTHGWKQFVENHDIQVGYVLVFNRGPGLLFSVTIYGHNLRNILYEELSEDPVYGYKSSSFIMKISKSHVSRAPAVHLPVRFTHMVGLHEKEEIEVMDEIGILWPLKSKCYNCRDKSRIYFCKGWRQFYTANGMEPGQIWHFVIIRKEAHHKTSAFKAEQLHN